MFNSLFKTNIQAFCEICQQNNQELTTYVRLLNETKYLFIFLPFLTSSSCYDFNENFESIHITDSDLKIISLKIIGVILYKSYLNHFTILKKGNFSKWYEIDSLNNNN
jgi:hypothetical protein